MKSSEKLWGKGRASHRLSLVSVFLPRICLTCWAWSRSAWMPASSSASNGAFQ